VIRDNGIGTVLPAPGQGVYVHALTVTGSEELEVTRSTDGTLELEEVGNETEAAQIESAVGTESSPGECSDRAYTDRDHAVKGDPVWYFNPRTIPNELSRESALRAITQRDGEHPEHARQLRSWKRCPQPRVHGLRRPPETRPALAATAAARTIERR
jgi:hypothetical protein